MSRLYFTPVDKAFTLGSSQIKDTQEEIANLKKLIFESSQNSPEDKKIKQKPQYERIGPPDKQISVFNQPQEQDNFDYNLLNKDLTQIGFTNVKTYNHKTTEHSHVDDFSKAYLPHLDENGILMSLNIEATK